MVNAPVFTTAGERKGEQALPESLFDGTIHEAAMWQAVKAYLANQRQATAATKTRAEVSGGTSKPWRQKGTGRARQGSIRSPQWRGGGNVFGPRADRNFRQELPRKVRSLARRSAYNSRAQDGALFLIEPLEMEAPRTKTIIGLVESVEARGNVLILTVGHKPNVYLSARNIPGVQVRQFGHESTYDLLWADTVIVETGAFEGVQEVSNA